MDGPAIPPSDDHLDQVEQPPARVFERLRQLAGYSWDETRTPYHTSYDNWHIFGTRFVSLYSTTAATSPSPQPHTVASPSALAKLGSRKAPPGDLTSLPLSTPHSEAGSEHSAGSPLANFPSSEAPFAEEPIVAKISYHVLREERGFHIAKGLASSTDPEGDHIAKPIEFIRLPPLPGDRGPIVVAIHRYPGENHMFKLIDLGPAWYWTRKVQDKWESVQRSDFKLDPPISLEHFLDFAIGASQCLEMIHHGQGVVHGEIRGDAFHFNVDTHKVKLTTFGSGLRSFEHGLTSTGWSALSKQLGAKNKLLYISPEQTGRMPAEPDSRTDIYSLGVLFWTLLTQRPVFDGDSPLDIVQGVLGRRIPNVTAYRMDIPDVIGRIIQKCTSKNVNDRYHSASGLRYDLVQVQQFLAAGDHAALKEWQIASKDGSSFFTLPTKMIGRDKDRAELLKVIDRVARSHTVQKRANGKTFSDSSNLSAEVAEGNEGSSDTSSNSQRSGSINFSPMIEAHHRASFPSITMSSESAGETTSSGNSSAGAPGTLRLSRNYWKNAAVSLENRSDGAETPRYSSGMESSSSLLSRQLGTAKLRRRGSCEVVIIEGAGGLGKSCLVQSVLADVRRRGYCATAKFDTARRQAFGPLLKLLSSLFRQVWGERNTETPFHQHLKRYVRPAWPMLHQVLGLPEFLLGTADAPLGHGPSSPPSSAQSKTIASLKRTGGSSQGHTTESSSGQSHSSMLRSHRTSVSSHDILSGGSSFKSMRLMSTFLDVLSLFTQHKFICFSLDDLHFADDESLELISQIVAARLKMVIIMTYRPEEFPVEKLQRVLHPESASGDSPRFGGPVVTKIKLSPLSEEDIIHYVATTLCRPAEDISPLALVIQSKTAGNPFYMREMLSACYRKKCVWYDYKDSQWRYDLERLFDQFRGEQHYDVLDTAFITRRLKELPPAARSILAWGALLGQTFSFAMICRLMSGEFHYADDSEQNGDHYRKSYSEQDAAAGLRAAITAYIIVPSETDDRFRFAHDRYVQAAAALRECNSRMMHFVIAQTLLKYYSADTKWRDNTASHICEAVDIIKKRVSHREPFRKLLCDCARASTESGARATAAKYYSNAVALLQSKPWDDTQEDVSYAETFDLYMRAAECYLYMGRLGAATDVLQTVFKSAHSATDQAAARVLESRIYAQGGNSKLALQSLKLCLKALEVKYDEHPSFEKCDAQFKLLAVKMQDMMSVDRNELLSPPGSDENGLSNLGAVLAETISAAFWSDRLQFYNLSLVMIELHLQRGAFPQSGLAFIHISMIALARFNMMQFTVDTASMALQLIDKYRDPYCVARGYVIYSNWVGHVQHPISANLHLLEDVVEYATAAGDRITAIVSLALCAQLRFYASENLADLETFCLYGCEEIPDWHKDTRGGTLLIAVRQTCRALQGKTRASIATEVFSDDQHSAEAYKTWLQRTDNGGRAILLYETMELVPLFLYGHYEEAVEVGQRCYENSELLWSARNTRLAMLFYGLALAGKILRQQQDPRPEAHDLQAQTDAAVKQVSELNHQIKAWQGYSDINYLAWSKLLDAQVAEMKGNVGHAIQNYEEALDHASEHNFVLEEALGNYLMANIYIRHHGRRSAKAALREAIVLFRQLGATGIAERVETEHSLILHGAARNMRSNDVGIQTDFAAEPPSMQYRNDADHDGEETPHAQAGVNDAKGDRIGAWRGAMHSEVGVGLPALDMIDLHAILVSSQVISSVLVVEELLKTMCDVILQNCGGSATLAAIIVQDEDKTTEDKSTDRQPSDWCVAASGNPEEGAEAHIPGIPLSGTDLVAENVILYCTRFREVVFLRDLVSDERFGNVSEQWLERNPESKAVIAIPICHGSAPLLGVLYLEGVAGAFTDRNVTVLQLLVNQIGISYSNALSMKAVEKVSAENKAAVTLQKRALATAIEAETKAKNAEAEAKRNVKLAEEAAKAKSIFLANVSHELRTPLNGVIGNSELLRDSNLNREQQEMADSIRVSADLLLTVINDILDFSRMEADKMKLYIIAFNPEEMVREVVRAVSYSNREKTSKKNVKIIRDINLPPMLIYGDPIRLHQVLGNLIGNSLKFTEDGSITIGARMDSETEDQATLTFWVKDTGIGISQQQMQKLFQPFSQADASTARKYGGSGLGLSICKSLIETMMKGRIQLESEEGQGTTAHFTVTFDKAPSEVVAGDAQTAPLPLPEPALRPSAVADVHSDYMPYADLARIPKDQLRICIAEDNAINAKIAMQYMQRLGYTKVDSYDNGMKAVEGLRAKALEGKPYHVILMDVQMPVLDGYEATKLLRNDPSEAVRKILVIAMTASAIQGDREKCLAAGMNDYLAKPVRSDVLKKKLETYLGAQVGFGTHQQPPNLPLSGSAVLNKSSSSQHPLERSLSIPRVPPPPSPPAEGDVNGSATPTQESTTAAALAHRPVADAGAPGPPLETMPNGDASPTAARRQPRKLTKTRRDSDMSAKEKLTNGSAKKDSSDEARPPATTEAAENTPPRVSG